MERSRPVHDADMDILGTTGPSTERCGHGSRCRGYRYLGDPTQLNQPVGSRLDLRYIRPPGLVQHLRPIWKWHFRYHELPKRFDIRIPTSPNRINCDILHPIRLHVPIRGHQQRYQRWRRLRVHPGSYQLRRRELHAYNRILLNSGTTRLITGRCRFGRRRRRHI